MHVEVRDDFAQIRVAAYHRLKDSLVRLNLQEVVRDIKPFGLLVHRGVELHEVEE